MVGSSAVPVCICHLLISLKLLQVRYRYFMLIAVVTEQDAIRTGGQSTKCAHEYQIVQTEFCIQIFTRKLEFKYLKSL